ncbi:positive regulator of sigma(E), RseC/MucC [Candidatus Vecturithrix granuli]|uniref:Positive regulator of sigma(E), RseC/MucC n=1 Tax=Vecturithrix granuli TaxID=1499967 RepID=A0A081C243_VECG1|nr:positive regulator of sigma(E), RseC/MucC [Candidatus Vecturithrix granuli]
MISEIGRVTKLNNGKACVEIEKRSACADCHAGCVCDLGKSVMLIDASDPIGVHENDTVQLSIPTESALRASFVVYGIPLIALISGVLGGEYLGKILGISTVLEILGGFTFLGISLVFIKLYDNVFRQNRKNQPVITKVIHEHVNWQLGVDN